jgi:hypothetical protein
MKWNEEDRSFHGLDAPRDCAKRGLPIAFDRNTRLRFIQKIADKLIHENRSFYVRAPVVLPKR